MCVVNKAGKYELIICDLHNDPLLSIDFSSISLLCRILDEVDTSKCKALVFRKSDCQEFDTEVLLELWRNQ